MVGSRFSMKSLGDLRSGAARCSDAGNALAHEFEALRGLVDKHGSNLDKW